MMQGTEETRRALEDLREYCSSPECDTWRLVSRLQSPTRYVTIPVGGFGEAPPEKGTFFTLQVYERVRDFTCRMYGMVGKSVKRPKRANRCVLWL